MQKTHLGTETLKSGEALDVYNVIAPAGDYGLDLVDFIHGPGRGPFPPNIPWHRYCERVWQGAFADEVLVVWQVGELDGAVVGLVGYSTPLDTLDVCTWGHVVTQTEHRNKGIATALTRYSIEDFKARGGRAMYLGSSREGPSHRAYEKNGFRDYRVGSTGVIMRLELIEDFEAAYFALTDALRVDKPRIADMPRIEALINQSHWGVKSYADKVIGSQGYEGQFLALWERLEQGASVCHVLRGPQQQLYGAAWTSPSDLRGSAPHARVFDLVVHPHGVDHGAALTAATLAATDGELLVAYTAGPDEIRRNALTAAGFALEVSLTDQIELDGRRVALDVWHLHR